MGVSGNLKTMLPGDLLQWLSLGQKTGTLVVANKAVEKKVFFRSGRIISSASNNPREYLGQFLISHGYLSEPELMKAMDVQLQSGILLGKILVMIDVITEPQLQRLMRRKAEEEIYDIFLWTEGDFHFVDDQLPTMEMIPLMVDVTGLIMEGTRRVDEWARIREVLPNELLVPVMQRATDPEELEDVEKTVVSAIDGRRSVAEIVLESRSSSFTVSSTICQLVREGYATLTDPARPQQPAAVTTELPPFEDFREDDEILSLLARAQQAMRDHDYEKAQRMLKAAENLDPNHARVRNAIKGAEAAILSDLRRQGMAETRVPRVIKPLEEITQMNFTPNEGFILSRINGQWDLGSLIKISPIREPDAMLIFYKLWKDEIIAFEDKK